MSHIDLDNYSSPRESSIAIGIFDGVHLGHRAVLSATRAAADSCELAALALTFEPHPMCLIAPERAPRLLCCFAQKAEWMTQPGLVEAVVVARFDRAFADLSPLDFAEQVLAERLHAREVRVGADFRFGRGRSGAVPDLERLGEQFGFAVKTVDTVAAGERRVSSSQVRALVDAGQVAEAAVLLGRPFTVRGEVVEGKRLGRTIGFPTANLQPEAARQLLPRDGVYAGCALVGGRRIRAAISVGVNPTTDGSDSARKIEAFLMDGFSGELYGLPMDLEFVAWLRDEHRFDSLSQLVEQMKRDVARAADSVTVR